MSPSRLVFRDANTGRMLHSPGYVSSAQQKICPTRQNIRNVYCDGQYREEAGYSQNLSRVVRKNPQTIPLPLSDAYSYASPLKFGIYDLCGH